MSRLVTRVFKTKGGHIQFYNIFDNQLSLIDNAYLMLRNNIYLLEFVFYISTPIYVPRLNNFIL